MRKCLAYLGMALLALACQGKQNQDTPAEEPQAPDSVENPIGIGSPTPSSTLQKLSLSEEHASYVAAGNAFAFKCLSQLSGQESVVFSPLSLQYALGMTANGATGETLQEIVSTLGYGKSPEALNAYCNALLNQLPALDPEVDLRLTDAMLVKKDYPVKEPFRQTLEEQYYAPVEYFEEGSKKEIVDRINEWASRSTNGFINPFISENDISDQFAAAILNALYFKAKWEGTEHAPLFETDLILKNQDFRCLSGAASKVDMLPASRWFRYARREGYRVVAIPYAGGKFDMYILLPDAVDGLSALVGQLTKESWADVTASLRADREVHLRLPKFEVEQRYTLSEMLQQMGIRRAFKAGEAQFEPMFEKPGYYFWIGSVLQKARIKVTEWGTEAAAVTAVVMEAASALPDEELEVDFFADHPFVYVIAERSSGVILFEGTFTGE